MRALKARSFVNTRSQHGYHTQLDRSFSGSITMQFSKSNKLANVCYDIRGPVLKHAKRLEEEGHRILKLNIGNPAPFGFEAPDEILQDVIRNLPTAQGYSDSKGLFSARKAVMQYYQQKQVEGVGIEDIYLGNGVSELIVMSMQALLNNGDEVLVPAPDYPLWTAAVRCPAATRCITCATSRPTGGLIWPTSRPRSPRTPRPW
jgi:alanine-synthesizing transaminase